VGKVENAPRGRSVSSIEPIESCVAGRNLGSGRREYDVTADGERFLMSVLAGEPSPIVVILNWFQDVEQGNPK